MVNPCLLVPLLEIKWERRKQLLSIPDDYFCSLIDDNNETEDDVEVPDQVFGEAIKNFWAGGERNVMVTTAEIMEMRGAVFAWKVVEMESLVSKKPECWNTEIWRVERRPIFRIRWGRRKRRCKDCLKGLRQDGLW